MTHSKMYTWLKALQRHGLVAVLASAALAAGCTLFREDFPARSCAKSADCFRAQGEYCNLTTHLCEMLPDAAPVPPRPDARPIPDAPPPPDTSLAPDTGPEADAGTGSDAGAAIDAATGLRGGAE